MEKELPWTRWIIPLGNPVGLTTNLGVLLTGDDGNIYIACANNKAYAIEVSIKPGCLEGIISRTPTEEFLGTIRPFYGSGPYGLGNLPSRLSHDSEPYNWKSPSALLSQICSASKSSTGSNPYPYVRTNTGLEPFDHFIHSLDLDAWSGTSIPLERIVLTSKIDLNVIRSFEHDGLEYKAREIKIKERTTDRVFNGNNRMHESRMSKAFFSVMSVDPMPAWYRTMWMASPGVVFLPSVEKIDCYHPTEIERRRQAQITSKHALENMNMNRSECSWEFDAWRDIFFKIRDDPLLAMDKHEAVFLEDKSLDKGSNKMPDTPLGTHTVRAHRIPDCTFGLSVKNVRLEAESRDRLLETLLSSEFLRDLFWHPQSGLISDPKWLSFELAFPWAVYEAKKSKADPVVAQVRRSSEIYLNMLHDLCLLPGPPGSARPYRIDEKSHFQVFSLTSEGPNWKLYVCYRRTIPELPLWLQDPDEVPQYDMKQIWEGDITDENVAWQLHCIVDQIHQWAVKTFRPFILDHLEAWHLYLITAQASGIGQDSSASMPRSLNRNSDLRLTGTSFRTRMESFKGTEEPLDILDQEVSQQEHDFGSDDFTGVHQETPWWTKYAKPEVMRQRILTGQSQHPVTPKQRRKISHDSRKFRRVKKEGNRLWSAYEAQESKQNADKVQSPRTFKRMRHEN